MSRGELTISVGNHGQPIPKDVHDRLFQPFFRAGVSSGNRLGLDYTSRRKLPAAMRGTSKWGPTRTKQGSSSRYR
ncbi:sensor histidine kinase [Phyllobacterium salinisoli]|uniref:Sensor histidine kinase n=1 Tax=Phyllobacterium salinisoli TaxID=1899321 RepID=A0A368K0S6_9HYPH|nr:sensor histidine kinase [Phyllobacterium salinisoli]